MARLLFKILSFLCVCPIVSLTASARNVYMEVKAGACFPQNKNKEEAFFKSGSAVSAEIGYRLEALRLDVQLGYSRYKMEGNDAGINVFNGSDRDFNKTFTAFAITSNIYYDYKLSKKFFAYLGAGIGFMRINFLLTDKNGIIVYGENNARYSLVKNCLLGQFMTGITYDINSSWALSLGYRCMRMKSSVQFHNAVIENEDSSLLPPLKTPLFSYG